MSTRTGQALTPGLSVLTQEALNHLHEASLRILERVGVRVPHAAAVELLLACGAVDAGGGIVRIPPEAVMNALATAGRSFILRGSTPDHLACFGQGRRNYNQIAGEAHWLDDSGVRRPPTLGDVVTAACVGERMPAITVVGAMADPADVPPEVRCVHVAATLLKYTHKPITFWYHDGPSARFVNELLMAVAGSREQARRNPRTYAFLEPISPLSFPQHGLDVVQAAAELGLPVSIGPMAQAGATAPATLAGTVAQENAEILAGICLVQAICPGTPVCYGGIAHAFDMRTTQMIFAGPEQALMAIALTQMGKSYRLPVYVNVGLTDSKIPDAQAGAEIAVTLACGAMAGADIFGHLGICGVDQAASLDMLMLQEEVIGYVERMMRGIRFGEEFIAENVIDAVGPGGNYLSEEHTVQHYRQEVWMPKIFDRTFFEAWRSHGGTDVNKRLRARRDELLASPPQPVIGDDLIRELDGIVQAADKRLRQ